MPFPSALPPPRAMAFAQWSSPSATTSIAATWPRGWSSHGLQQVLINAPPGDLNAGERGLAGLPGREADFRRALLEQALPYAQALRCPRIHVMAGRAAGRRRPRRRTAPPSSPTWPGRQRRRRAHGIELLIEPINTARRPRLPAQPAGRGPCHRRRGRRAEPEGADGPVPLPDRRRRRGHEAAPVPAHRPRRPPADRRRAAAPRARPGRAVPPLPVRADRRIGLQRPRRLRIPSGGRHLGRAGLVSPLQDLTQETRHETAHHRRRRLRRRPTGAHAAGARHAGRPAHRPAWCWPTRSRRRPTCWPTRASARASGRCSTSARRWPTRPSTACSTWPRRCRANARPISTWACAPTWTARARCSKRCARASSATAR